MSFLQQLWDVTWPRFSLLWKRMCDSTRTHSERLHSKPGGKRRSLLPCTTSTLLTLSHKAATGKDISHFTNISLWFSWKQCLAKIRWAPNCITSTLSSYQAPIVTRWMRKLAAQCCHITTANNFWLFSLKEFLTVTERCCREHDQSLKTGEEKS